MVVDQQADGVEEYSFLYLIVKGTPPIWSMKNVQER